MKTKHTFLYYWLPVILLCVAIFVQSALPSPEGLPPIPYLDKILHFIGYFILGALFFRAFNHTLKKQRTLIQLIFYSILSATLYGISDEFHQYFVAVRQFDPMDILADFLGSVIGVILYSRLWALSRNRLIKYSFIDKIIDFL